MRLGALLLLLMALAGCASPVRVNSDYDVNATFDKYKTYAWVEREGGQGMASDLVNSRIHAAIDRELQAHALSVATGEPDVYVMFYTNVESKVSVTDWGYNYSDYYWGHGGSDIDIQNYREGTLVIDIIDAGTKRMVWRGAGQKTLDEGSVAPEELTKRVNEAVAKILSEYPPKR